MDRNIISDRCISFEIKFSTTFKIILCCQNEVLNELLGWKVKENDFFGEKLEIMHFLGFHNSLIIGRRKKLLVHIL